MDFQTAVIPVEKTGMGISACPLLKPSTIQCRHCIVLTCQKTPAELNRSLPCEKRSIPSCPTCHASDQVISLTHSWHDDGLNISPSHNNLCLRCKTSFL